MGFWCGLTFGHVWSGWRRVRKPEVPDAVVIEVVRYCLQCGDIEAKTVVREWFDALKG